MSDQPELSVIVPFYNEQENIRRMHAAIVAAVEPLGVPFEMVFVNDGSRDGTLEIATEIAREDDACHGRQLPPQLRPDTGHGRRHRAGARHASS